MKIVVTGGAGFIGTNTCENLMSNGHHVTCFDNFLTGIHLGMPLIVKRLPFTIIIIPYLFNKKEYFIHFNY